MKVTTKLNPTSKIEARLGIQPSGPVQSFFTNTCYKKMSKFVPGGTMGFLNRNVSLKKDSITYESPYAQYQYHGKVMVDPKTGKAAFFSEDYGYWSRPKKYGIPKVLTERSLKPKTPGTGAFWDKKMWTSCGDEVVKEIQDYVDRGGKN